MTERKTDINGSCSVVHLISLFIHRPHRVSIVMLGAIMHSESSSEEDSYSSSDLSSSYCWISWFVNQPGNEFFLEVDEEYIRDNFNLYGLRPLFQYYDHALEMILDTDCPDEEDLMDRDYKEVYKEAEQLYGLIHARFVMSSRGLTLIHKKYMLGEYGSCPRMNCEDQSCLPIGLDDSIGKSKVKLFCPRCEQVYAPRGKNTTALDSAYIGSSLPHMFLQTYPDLLPLDDAVPYSAKVFGFKVHNHQSVVAKSLENRATGVRLPRPNLPVNCTDDFDTSSSS